MFLYFFCLGMIEEVVEEMMSAYYAAEWARVERMLNQECTRAS